MGRKYANPPILEAVCEFRLSRKTPWDITVPGRVYEKLREEFPLREDRVVEDWDITYHPVRSRGPILREPRLLCFTNEKNLFIQLGRRLLSVHVVRPYPTWSAFKPRIAKAWESLAGIVEIRGLSRIGLQYVNRIEVPSLEGNLKDYFDFYPFLGEHVARDVANFMLAVEYRYADGRDRCVTILSSSMKSSKTFFLEIDYFLFQSELIPPTEAISWVEEAHSRVEEIFEGCITDRLREQFQPVES
ncbi:MAG: TIGR04255 family protein [Thermoguttaceae bacterium]|nr:TIGR04255 family protein [Thermoguttaceae bacterium]